MEFIELKKAKNKENDIFCFNKKYENFPQCWEFLSNMYPLFKSLYAAHIAGKSFKEWLISLPADLIEVHCEPSHFSKEEQEEADQIILVCSIYILGLQKNNIYSEHKVKDIDDATKQLKIAFLSHSVNLQVKNGGIPIDIIAINYEDGWKMPESYQASQQVKFEERS